MGAFPDMVFEHAHLPVDLETLQHMLGVCFRDPRNLRAAFVHESYAHEVPLEISNERLEFLGDAVLGLVISEMLYQRFPEFQEGELTRMKAALVSRVALAEQARDMGLGRALLLGRGGEVSGGRERTSLLANVFEAVLGALYLDSGLTAAREFVQGRVDPLLEALPSRNRDYKSLLQQETQKYFKALPIYRVLSEVGPPHNRVFTVEVSFSGHLLGRGTGNSKKDAQQLAAHEALASFPAVLALLQEARAADDEATGGDGKVSSILEDPPV